MIDANEAALMKYEEETKRQEEKYAAFENSIEQDIEDIRNARLDIEKMAEIFNLDIDVDEVINELI